MYINEFLKLNGMIMVMTRGELYVGGVMPVVVVVSAPPQCNAKCVRPYVLCWSEQLVGSRMNECCSEANGAANIILGNSWTSSATATMMRMIMMERKGKNIKKILVAKLEINDYYILDMPRAGSKTCCGQKVRVDTFFHPAAPYN
jgi:hypothetical protein